MDDEDKIRLVVVDDHTLFRRGLIALLAADAGLAVVGDAADASEAQRKIGALQPDVILLDNHLPGVTGIAALPALKAACPEAKVLMLTVSADEEDLGDALRGGASGYLLKTIEGDALSLAIRRAVAGDNVIAPELIGKLVSVFRRSGASPESLADAEFDELSPRETEILTAIGSGASNKEIARRLSIAESTVKIHVQHLLRKLRVASRVQLAVIAKTRGLI
ncbi:MAG: response regulator transcription factor [Xanthomonadales bacterium]|nr:response regulator transcription factor [Xanthomonadales bacterium]MBK7145614.1 response regulator transcription factor [Xanthomonadales bacterium]